jgi:hypothetical protein
MGADLYINKLSQPCQKKWKPVFDKAVEKRNEAKAKGNKEAEESFQKQVSEAYDKMYSEGYFRDSYNASSVLATLGLSWWADVAPLQNKQGNITGKNLLKFLKMVEEAKQELPTKEGLKGSHAQVDEEGENSVEGWHKYYTEKRIRLIEFIKQAIKLKSPIQASL